MKVLAMLNNEIKNYLKSPASLVLVFLPVLMSKLIGLTMQGNEANVDIFLVSMWVIFAQVMVGIMLMGPNLLEEKDNKTLHALLCTPLSFKQILFTKGAAILILSLFSQVAVVFVSQGTNVDSSLLFPMIAGGTIFTMLGLIIGLKAKSIQSGTAISSVVMVGMFLIVSIYTTFPPMVIEICNFIPSVALSQIMNSINDTGKILLQPSLIIMMWLVVGMIVLHIIEKQWKK